MPRGFASPTDALAQIVECLGDLCETQRVHVGSAGSGETIACCPGCLLRVETGVLRPTRGPVSLVNLTKCQAMTMDVSVIYTHCFQSNTKGGGARKIEDLTADGLEIVVERWEAMRTLACCPELNQRARLLSADDIAPGGNCAGWQLTLEVDVVLCGCERPPDPEPEPEPE